MDNTPDGFWARMTVDEFAAVQKLTGTKVIFSGGIPWRKVRPFFFRPLFPFQAIDPHVCRPPRAHWLGCAQHAVAPGVATDSRMWALVFDEPGRYSPQQVGKKIRYQIRSAGQNYSIRPLTDMPSLAAGHAAYLSFLERTGYSFHDRRRDPAVFARWAGALLSFPQARVLGAYERDRLAAVSVSYLVEDVLCYTTFFAESGALRRFVSDAMLHFVREQAAQSAGIRLVFAGMAGMERGLDRFYLHRGAGLHAIPSRISGNRLALGFLRLMSPQNYRKLVGDDCAAASQVGNAEEGGRGMV
jgi:hypothetical protein